MILISDSDKIVMQVNDLESVCFGVFFTYFNFFRHELNKCLWPSKTVFETEGYLKNAKERLTYLATLTVMVQNCSVSICFIFQRSKAW